RQVLAGGRDVRSLTANGSQANDQSVSREYLGRRLALTAKAMREDFDTALSAVGGSLSTWIVLRHAQSGTGFSQRELAAALAIEGSTLVRHLDRLEAAGLIERKRDPVDRRVTRVTVTAEGQRHLQAMTEVADRSEREVRRVVTRDEYRTVMDAL